MPSSHRAAARACLLAAVLPLLTLAGAARGESLNHIADLKPGSRLAAYFFGSEQAGALYQVGRQWDAKLGLQQDCKGAYNVQPVNLYLLKPIQFPDGQPHPVAGAWQHRFVFERCGKRMTYNAVFLARAAGKPEVKPYIPGNTNAAALLVSDALKGAYPAAALKLARNKGVKECKEVELIDTRVTQPPRLGAPWEEAWTFRGCGRDVELAIAFSPDGKGGTYYSIKPGQ